MRSPASNNARLFHCLDWHMHQHVEMIGHNQTERHKPFTRHMVVPHGFQNHRRIFNKIRHATRPGTDCHEEERPRKAIRRVVIEAFTDRQIVHVVQCSTNEMPVQRPHLHRNVRTDGRRWTIRPRGPPGTSAPTNAAQPWCAGPHSRDARGRIHGRGGRPRPPAPRTGTTPVDDASARAAGDVGPYQHRTAVMCRAAQP